MCVQIKGTIFFFLIIIYLTRFQILKNFFPTIIFLKKGTLFQGGRANLKFEIKNN